MTRLAVFDCDGTLIDSQHSICAAMEDAFARTGLRPPSRAAIRRIVGLSLVEAVAALIPDDDDALHRAVAAEYKLAFQRLRAAGGIEEPLFDGIVPVLDALLADGWLLGVATGKSDRGLALAHHALSDRFITLQTADRHPSKPHPAMLTAAIGEAGATQATTVMIGDTSFDLVMARAAGVRALGVAWGYHPVHELRAADAHAVAVVPAQLLDLMEDA